MFRFVAPCRSLVSIFDKLLTPPTACRSRRSQASPGIPQKSKIAALSRMDGSSTQRLFWACCVLHLYVILPLFYVCCACCAFCTFRRCASRSASGGITAVLRVLRVLQIQANRLWTWLEGEAEESEDEEEEEEEAVDDGDEEEEEEEEEEDDDVPLTPHGKKQARGTVKREHSEDEPDDVPEKHSSSAAKASGKAARSTMVEVKQEPQTMAENKKRKAEERSPPKVQPKKSEAEMPKKKKDKDKPARGNVSFAIGEKGPQKSISAARTRAVKFQHEGGYDHDLDTMQRILETDFNATVGHLVMHYKECLSEEPKSKQELGLALLLHTSVRALSVQSVLRCGTKNGQSAAAAREHFEKRLPSSSPRQVAEGILKGL